MPSNIHRPTAVSDLDMAISARQAFGATYSRPKDLVRSLSDYRAGQLVLHPQPVWLGDPMNWTADPFQDRNWRFQHHTLRWMNPLRWAALDGDIEAKNEWIRIARSWMESNVPAESSRSDFAWKDMVDGNRAIQLSLGAPLVDESDKWFVELLEYHRNWLMDPSHIVGKNHGLHQHQGLLVVGAVLRDKEAVDTAVSRMREQFKTTFDEQGTNNEGSSAYHQMNLAWWSIAWKRVELEGVTPPGDAAERLAAAGHVLAQISLPDGQLPQIGDSQRGRVNSGYSPYSDFVASTGVKGIKPQETVVVLDRGYIASRSGWGTARPLKDESHTLIRYGKDMASHSHDDRGSVHIYTQGQRWLVDSGFHSYQTGAPEVKYLKSRQAHNMASIVGVKPILGADVDLISHEVTDKYHDFLLLDHGYPDHHLTRRVTYILEADCWIITDKADPSSNAQISQSWNVEPGADLKFLDNGFRLQSQGKRFAMFWLGKGTRHSRHLADKKSFDGWVGTKWKTMVPGIRVSAHSRDNNPHIVTLLGSHSPYPLSLVESHVASNGSIMVHVARGTQQWRCNIGEETITVSEGW